MPVWVQIPPSAPFFYALLSLATAVHAGSRAVAKYKDGVLKITAPKVTKTSNGARDAPIESE